MNELTSIVEAAKGLLIREKVLYLNIKVIPKARKTEWVDLLEDGEGEKIWKVKVAAVPEKGKANTELCRYFADLFQVPRQSVMVSHGQTSSRKVIKIVLN